MLNHDNSAHLDPLSYISTGQGDAVSLVQPHHCLGEVSFSCNNQFITELDHDHLTYETLGDEQSVLFPPIRLQSLSL